jgi:hypothetical protein
MKKLTIKNVYLFFSSVFFFLLHIPFVFAKNKPAIQNFTTNKIEHIATDTLSFSNLKNVAVDSVANLYQSLCLNILGLSQQAFTDALKGLNYVNESGKICKNKIISIIDFTKPSSQKRLFVIDLANQKVLQNTYVAHGMNSGREYANQFSNTPESNKSSLGFYRTGGTYIGSNGYSLKLEGLEKGINDNASKRDIVMHGAAYVNEDYIHSQGYIGRSQGCPALPIAKSKIIIDEIKNGTCLFIFGDENNYEKKSKILNR